MKVIELRIVAEDDLDMRNLFADIGIDIHGVLGICELKSDGFGRLTATAAAMTDSEIFVDDGRVNHEVRMALATGHVNERTSK